MRSSSFSSSDPGFIARSRLFFERATQAAQNWYDASGKWLAASRVPPVRERYWIAFSLYATGAHDFADAVILGGETRQSHMGWKNPSSFDIFHTNIACLLLKMHRERMSAAAAGRLEELVREGFGFDGNRRPDYHFRGYNDNMPAKASMGLILGGEMLNDPAAVEQGVWNLSELRNMFKRRGAISEWNSPTYSAGTLHAIAEIAHYARHPEAREMARAVEERLWIDLSARFHSEIGMLAGPHSRAYTADTVAHLSCVASLLWFVLGDSARVSPMELFNPENKLVIHNQGNIPFNVAQMSWFAAGSYHLPARALEMFSRKKYPFRAVAMSEIGYRDMYPAHPIRIETYLQPDYAVGTASTHWLDGSQSAPYFVTYKRAAQVKSYSDVGTVFHKFTINDDAPGTVQFATDPNGRRYANSGEQDNLSSRAGMVTLQSDSTVMALTSPDPMLGEVDKSYSPTPLTRLAERLIFPSHFGGADEIRVGNESRESWTGDVPRGTWIGCRRGRLLIAIRPLVFLPEPQAVNITLEKINNYETIRSTFYEGPARTFTRAELQTVYGGFVAEHAGVDEYPSLQAFMDELSESRFTDYYWTSRRARYRRPAGSKRPALELEFSWTPGSVVTRYALINGQPVAQDKRVEIDGMTEADFPLLTDPWTSVPSYFPWPKLYADWGAGNTTGYVGDRDQD